MKIYITIYLLLIIATFIEQFNTKNDYYNKMIFKFNILVLYLLTIFRYNIAADYFGYKKVYIQVNPSDLTSTLEINIEKGFLILAFLFKKLNMEFHTFIVTLNTIIFIFLYKIIIKEKRKNLSLFLYFSLYYFFNNFNVVRQGIVQNLYLFSILYLSKNKNNVYIFLNILSSFIFHRIGFIVLGMNIKKLNLKLLIILSFIIFFFNIDGFMIKTLNENFNHIELFRRLNHYYFIKSGGVISKISIVAILNRCFLFAISYFLFKKTKENYEKLLCYSLIYSVLIFLIFSRIGILAGRISQVFQIVSIIVIPRALSYIKSKEIKNLFYLFVIFYGTIFLAKELSEKHPITKEYYYIPYTNIFNQGEAKKWEEL